MTGQGDAGAPLGLDSGPSAASGGEHAETLIVDSDTHRVLGNEPSRTEAMARPAGPPAPPELPAEFGRYRVERLLGRGAMGAVFLARDTQLGRAVALKVPSFGDGAPAGSVQRFLREARAAATLAHPNICPIHDVGEQAGIQFISMGYVEGRPLADYIASGKEQPEKYVAGVVRKLALALQEAHDRGIIHRDLKPANIMIDRRNEPIVMDFGLARAIDDDAESRLTREGTLVGTPAYMAPEQLTGSQGLGPAVDVYALGVVLYEALAGRKPFGGSVVSVIGQIIHVAPPRLEELRPGVSPALAAICRRAMEKQPSDRYASMREFAEALTGFLKGSPMAAAAPPVSPAPPARGAATKPPAARPARRKADWWESAGPLPPAPLPAGQSGSRRRKKKSAAVPPAAWIAGGSVLGASILGAVLFAALGTGRDGDAPGSGPDAKTPDATAGAPTAAAVDPQPPAANQSRPPGEPTIQEKFAGYDLNKDGRLDKGEIPLHVIRRADGDGDLLVTRPELVQAERRLGRQALLAPPSPEEEAGLPGLPGLRPPPRGPGGRNVAPAGPPRRPGPRAGGQP
ncbi:MAG: serine/threonine-protein kinase [Planctomycetales bacterium]